MTITESPKITNYLIFSREKAKISSFVDDTFMDILEDDKN
jgi:hypothetical protein